MLLRKELLFLFSLFHVASYTDSSELNVKVKIVNNTAVAIIYTIDNFRYCDGDRIWKALFATESTHEIADYTTKYGYLELQIRDLGGNLIGSYTPSGNNKEVTISINNDINTGRFRVSRHRGFRTL